MSEDRGSFSVKVEIDVAWGEMDAFEHVNNVVYFRWFETARIAYFMAAGVMDHLEETGVGPILAETRCRFRRPVAYPDKVIASARVVSLAEDRFTMEYRLHSANQNVLAAEGDGKVVYYDYRGGAKAPVPASVRDAIVALDPDVDVAL